MVLMIFFFFCDFEKKKIALRLEPYPQDYASQCRLAMATSLNIPQVDVNSTDKNIFHEAIHRKEYSYYFDFVYFLFNYFALVIT